jgi:DNA gyrase/topoisomerase IV subunit A
MSDATLTRLTKLDRETLLAKLTQLDQQRRIVLALIRSRPRVARAKRREVAAHA